MKNKGVYKTRIDDEQVKVTISWNVDPSVMIKRPEKSKIHTLGYEVHKNHTTTIRISHKKFQMITIVLILFT